MASTSASSVQKSFMYDVFLSFRGEDTRKTFVDHLYHALDQKGIITYKDDEKIEKGERISEQLMRSIEESRFYIIVFSKTYASSSWCLEELVKIMECQKMTEHTAYPVFYDVEPTEVRHLNGAVGDAFAKLVAKHEKISGKRKRTLEDDKEEDVGRWRNALKEAASLAGMELKNTVDGHEAKFIQQIVEMVSQKLHFFDSSIDENLVGMETRVKDVVSSLELDYDAVRMIGIKGIGGGGKTTLARAVFDTISIRFEGKSFVENVREISNGSLFGLKDLQQLVLRNALNDQSINVPSVSDGKNTMKKMMGSRKILLVLDDVDKMDQLEALAGEPTWFKPGSRIIITTRDEQVLKAHQVNFIHEVNLLSNEEAIYLFNRYAFRREIPNQGYQKLSRKIVDYADGLPLTIKVLGSFLYGRIEGEWKDTIERLKTIPLKETLEKLELSYNGLEIDQKEIFLDIVCVLKGERKNNAIKILEACGFRAQIGLGVLEQKSLISISKDGFADGRLLLHDHIEEMGRNIVRRLHPDDPTRHSRLWIKKEIEDIMVNESGTEETKCIKLEYTDLPPAIFIKGLRKLKKLRFLYVKTKYVSYIVDEATPYMPDSLQSLYWISYPFKSLPKLFQGNKLANLKMYQSKISELWEGGERKVLNNLKFLDLFSSSRLRTFDLTVTPQLEELNLYGCCDLVELQIPIECPNLKVLNLGGSKVSNLNLGMTPHLEELNLVGCDHLVELKFPIECPNLKVLNLGGSKVSNLNLGMTPHLEKLNLEGCSDLLELQIPIECPNLKVLNLRGSKVSNLNLGMTPRLENLDLDECSDLVELKLPVECPNLKYLSITESKVSNLNLELTPNLVELHLGKCRWLQKIHAPVGCIKKLDELDLSDCSSFKRFEFFKSDDVEIIAEYVKKCPLHPESSLPIFEFQCKYDEPGSSWSGNLEKLLSSASGLCACKNLESLLETFCGLQNLRKLTLERSIPGVPWQFKHLKSLKIGYCDGIEQLPENISSLECLEELYLESCGSLRDISNSPMKCLKRLRISYCNQFEKLTEELECLEELDLQNCLSLREVTNIGMMKCLKRLHLFDCHQVERLSEELGRLECLERLDITKCGSLRDLPNSICEMKCLKYLSLFDCDKVEQLPEELGRLECLKELRLTCCKSLRDIPNSICKMKCLITLDLSFCDKLEKLPEELGSLECLKELKLAGWKSLRDIPNSICKMKCLITLDLSYCDQVEKLPEELGSLECLKELDIRSTSISCLPQSINQLKDLRIFGSREQLQAYGFTSVKELYPGTVLSKCYVDL